MNTYETRPQEPDESTPGYTYHVEPAHVGGQRFARCEGCGREILLSRGVEFLTHADGCPNVRVE